MANKRRRISCHGLCYSDGNMVQPGAIIEFEEFQEGIYYNGVEIPGVIYVPPHIKDSTGTPDDDALIVYYLPEDDVFQMVVSAPGEGGRFMAVKFKYDGDNMSQCSVVEDKIYDTYAYYTQEMLPQGAIEIWMAA